MSYSDASKKKTEQIIMSCIFLPLYHLKSSKGSQIIVYKLIVCKVIMWK